VPSALAPAALVAAAYVLTHALPILALGSLAARRVRSPLLRSLLPTAYAATALHHAWELAAEQAWAPAASTAASLVELLLPGSAATLSGLPIAGALALPVRLLLPRAAMALCAASAAVLAQQAARLPRGEAASGAGAIAVALALLLAPTCPPLVLLLAVAQAATLAALLTARARGEACAGAMGAAAAALLAVAQTQAFFLTGHLCEFAGLEYKAGFVGFDEFHLHRAAGLMAVETFGGMAAVALALPALAAALESATQKTPPAKGEAARRMGSSRGSLLTSMLLVFGLSRAAAAFCATLSAAVQRRHLYAWALFAPKFVFEVFFLLLTDVLVLVMGW
jgi:hypothetical protein